MNSLLDLVLRLLGGDEQLTAAYHQDPAGFANKYFGDLCGDDWKDLHLVLDQSGVVERHPEPVSHPAAVSHPEHVHHHEGDHAVAQLQNIVNNYTQIDRHAVTDQSTTQVINTGGGDFWQQIDNGSTTASGDGAVAAGHDIGGNVNTGQLDSSDHSVHTSDSGNDTTVVHGDGNLVGDHDTGNAVGDHDAVGAHDTVDDSDHHPVVVGTHQPVGHPVEKPVGDGSGHHYVDHPAQHETQHETQHEGSSDHNVDSFDHNDTDSFNHNDDSFNHDDGSFNHYDGSFNHYENSFNHDTVADNVVDDHSTTEQHGLLNVDDVLSHNNVPIDVDVPIHIL